MRHRTLRGVVGTIGVVFSVVAALIAPTSVAFAQMGPADGTVLAEGLNGAQGILIDDDGSVWVIDAGFGGETEIEAVDPATGQVSSAVMGDTAGIIQVAADGTQTAVASLPSVVVGQDVIGGSRLALLDGTLYATSGEWVQDASPEAMPLVGVVSEIGSDGTATPVAATWEFERDNNPDGTVVASHPYGLTAGPDGYLYVADAAGNAVLKVDPADGMIELVTVIDPIPGIFPSPTRNGELLADPVPTRVAFDADGNMYVSILSGAPFVPGSAKVVQISESGEVSDYATNLTMLTDLQTGPDGHLYAVQFGMFTDQGPVMDSGAVIRIEAGDASMPIIEGLSFDRADFNADGDVFVTINGVGPPGSGAVLRFDGVASGEEMMDEGETKEDETGEDAGEEMAEEDTSAEGEMTEEEMTEEEMAEEKTGEEGMSDGKGMASDGEMVAEDAGESLPKGMPQSGSSPLSATTTIAFVGLAVLLMLLTGFVRRRTV